MIELDGNYGEGGGQIVRTALALSVLTGEGFYVKDIRKGRKKGGLKAQHLTCIESLEKLCNAKVEGAELGSDYIKFEPRKFRAKNTKIDIGTAGSITLLMQGLLLPCLFANSRMKMTIKGGTDTQWSMPCDYFKEIYIPQLKKYARVDVELLKRGYYPKGGGEVSIFVDPKYKASEYGSFTDFMKHIREEGRRIELLEQGSLEQIKGISHASQSLEKAHVAERQAEAARMELQKLGVPIDIRTEYCDTYSDGSAVVLWAIFSKNDEIDANNPVRIGADSLGKRGKRSEAVGKEAADRLVKEIGYGAPVDEYLADNLIPFLGLSGGRMRVAKISNHTTTNIYVAEKFLGKIFKIDKIKNIIETTF